VKIWKQALVRPSVTIREAVKAIDDSKIQIALVVDENEHLLGTVTDGDVRRALLKGISLDDSVTRVMNTHPTVANQHDSQQQILAIMKQTTHRCVPVLDGNRRLVNVALLNEIIQSDQRDNIVVIMAGGLGSRLSPLTDQCPKPLLKVGAKPIMETILDSFREYGFRNFYLSVNFKAEMVKEHFGDGSPWGVSIRYIEEDKRLGTAGALALLPEVPTKPLLVMNGDLLTKINFQHLLDFHNEHQAKGTMCVREYDLQIPFGVVKIENHRIRSIDEKPVHRFFVNAGIYVLQPDTLDIIPGNSYFDMTSMFEKLVESGQETAVFPIREYWLDIGQVNDLEKARLEYGGLFE
jgi:dTDP-glucose pyrophosphorylase